MTTKKKYEKPSTKVFELKRQSHLLAGSSQLGATRNGYGDATEYEWED
jgi:hypothetical protein